jgi:hypothetical protein
VEIPELNGFKSGSTGTAHKKGFEHLLRGRCGLFKTSRARKKMRVAIMFGPRGHCPMWKNSMDVRLVWSMRPSGDA